MLLGMLDAYKGDEEGILAEVYLKFTSILTT